MAFAKSFATVYEKNIILVTSDAWSTSCLSHRPSKPGYQIVDWLILKYPLNLVFNYVGMHFYFQFCMFIKNKTEGKLFRDKFRNKFSMCNMQNSKIAGRQNWNPVFICAEYFFFTLNNSAIKHWFDLGCQTIIASCQQKAW